MSLPAPNYFQLGYWDSYYGLPMRRFQLRETNTAYQNGYANYLEAVS